MVRTVEDSELGLPNLKDLRDKGIVVGLDQKSSVLNQVPNDPSTASLTRRG